MRNLLILTALFLARPAPAAVDFEAYYAVEIRGKPVGVSVQRNDLEPKTKARTFSYLLKTTTADNDLEQFVKVEQDAKFKPLKYSFTSTVRKLKSSSKGVIKNGSLSLTMTGDAGQTETKTIALEPDTIFSAALGPVLAAKKPTKGQAYSFNAIFEEDDRVESGEILIVDALTIGSHQIYRTVLRYQTLEQEAWFLDDGTTIATQSTSLPVKTYLVADPVPALRDVEVPSALLATYFRNVPAGRENPVTKGQSTIPKDGIFKQALALDAFKDVKRIPLKIVD